MVIQNIIQNTRVLKKVMGFYIILSKAAVSIYRKTVAVLMFEQGVVRICHRVHCELVYKVMVSTCAWALAFTTIKICC